MDFRFPSSSHRLYAPRNFEKRLHFLLSHLPATEETEAWPSAHLLARESAHLHAAFQSLRKDLKGCPSLPGDEKGPFLMQAARQICAHLPLHRGRMLHMLRTFYQEQDMLCREADMLPAALSCALFEQLEEQLLHALEHAPEDVLLFRQRSCALTLEGLRHVARLPFDALLEHVRPVSRILQKDATYCRMDRESRAFYRQAVCRIAARHHLHEAAVARAALALTEGREGLEKEAGYYLLERPDQIAAQLMKKGFRVPDKQYLLFFVLPLFLSAALFAGVYGALSLPLMLLPFGLIAFSEHVRCFYYRLLRRLFPPRMLPRLRKREIRDKRLLVAVPTLLTDEKQVYAMARQLRTLHAATPHAHFMLLADFADAPHALSEEDRRLMQTADAAIRALNAQEDNAYLYLHRSRTWEEGQGMFCGRERKRGALECLNRLLSGLESPDIFLCSSLPLSSLAHRYDHVITLDADTFLPPGAAVKLQGALEHPLQKGRIAVIQPRMETLPSALRTRTQHLLAAPGCVDSYQGFVQNVYQDVFCRGSFSGKGIYDPALFLARTAPLPPGRILSHDLIEGELAGSAMAEDIVLYDGPPARISGWQKRLHRWTRGDWQLLPFLKDASLPLLGRWKMYDNLRSSLVAASEFLLLVTGALLQNPLLMLLGLPFPFRGMGKRLCLLPGKAFTQTDAAVRSLYRLFISKKQLLSWVTAAQTDHAGGLPLPCILLSLFSGACILLFSLLPGGFLPGLVPGLCFLLPPLFVDFLDQKRPLHPPITGEDRQALLSLCRDTWHFFEKNVHAATHFLPPDHVQLQPEKGPALRTSPTNMGLYLLSVLAAREMNLITTAQMARRMLRTVETMEQMETWQGHFYNWYDLTTLAPLPPLFISTVDSGNLCACLLCCAQGLRRHITPEDTAAHTLPSRLDRLARQMRFDRLYDPVFSLFHIGFHPEKSQPAPGHYDLLASECRLASYVAIMLRQVPMKHWFRLGRPTTRQGGGTALLSWGGTAFEYLMPTLLLPLYPGTLLHEGCLCAIRAQIAAAGHRPFGISESGYFAFDPDMHYQYRAFGLPSLALSRETEGQVVAPYASMLALPFFPDAALRNLHQMRNMGWYSEDGLFEAVDYTPGKMESGPHPVQSHMAHHQGMILCAACNLLTDFSLVRHFMLPAPARAYSFLLCEGRQKRPRPSPSLPSAPRESEDVSPWAFPASAASAQLLSGQNTTWLMDSRGNGLLKSGSRLWTRYFQHSPCGPRFYLKNVSTGAFICPQEQGNMVFESGCIRIPLHMFQVSGEMRLHVLPLDGSAVADIQLENKGPLPAEIEICSFLEVANGPFFADQPHPPFRDLSVSIHPHQHNALFCRRLSEKEQEPLLYHGLLGPVTALRRQGDRLLFLGRQGDYHSPRQLQLAPSETPCRTGAVICPCLSITGRLSLAPGKRAHVQFVTREVPLEADLPAQEALYPPAALSLCATRDAMTLGFLRIPPRALPLYSRMLYALCFAAPPPEDAFPPSPLSSLFPYGLSGQEPLLCVFLQTADKPLIRHALYAHAWLETGGIRTDLLFLCDEQAQDYFTPLQDAVRSLMDTLKAGRDHIHLAACSQKEALKIRSLCRLFFTSSTPLAAQLDALPLPPEEPLLHLQPSPLPVAPPLKMDNGYGGFTEEGDYCIHALPPAPWHNLLMGERFGTLVCETGLLHSFADHSTLNRLTQTAPDVHRPQEAEEYLLLDENGLACSLTGGLAIHSPGITRYHTLPFGLRCKMEAYSHPHLPLGLRCITLQAEEERRITLRCCVSFAPFLGHSTAKAEAPFVFAASSRQEGFAFACMQDAPAFTLPPSLAHARNPAACHMPGAGCGLFEMPVHILPHQPRSFCLVLGWARTMQEARQLLQSMESPGTIQRQVRRFWQEKLEGLQLFGANPPIGLFINRWLPYQARCARLMARCGPYQPGGAIGFRDQLQDLLCCLHTDAPFARQHLLLCAAHQYREGDVQHWWHPPCTGVRTRISDDALFLPYLTALYVEITGDESILREEIPFLVSPPLRPGEQDRYETPGPSAHTASLLQHGLLALENVALGPHGLPKMGSGDWNDGLNNVQGESVWLGFFLCMVYRKFAPCCDAETESRLLEKRRILLEKMEQAWAGQWYLRAWYQNGTPLGGPDTHPPRIDLICQCFACLAGVPRDHARRAVEQALHALYRPTDGLVQLLEPPFTPREQAGYIGAYLPHVRENGGQYTHAIPWLVMALCHLGEYERAWQIAGQALPLCHSDTRQKAALYRMEPYVLCGDIYAGENRGRGGWSWYTGSAAWLYYVYITVLLGFEKRGNRARLCPCPGGEEEDFSFIYRYHTATYHFTASRDILFPTLDGERLKDGWVSLTDDGRTHGALFPLRKA